MQPETSAFDIPMTTTDLRKDYSADGQALHVEDLPVPWAEADVEHNYTMTLFAFSWALLPVGFMVLMAVSDRYEEHRLTLAIVSFFMLLFAFVTGVMQRRSSLLEPRIQLAVASLGATAFSLSLLFGLDLDQWWWVSYGLIFGTVATMYVGLDHLASCNAPTYRLAWPANKAFPTDAFHDWQLQRGRWANGTLGTKRLENGTVVTLYGSLEEESTWLSLDCLCPRASAPDRPLLGVDFSRLATESNDFLSEE